MIVYFVVLKAIVIKKMVEVCEQFETQTKLKKFSSEF